MFFAYALSIASLAAVLFVLLDRYDCGAIADILKFLVLAVGLLTIVHKLLPLLGLDL